MRGAERELVACSSIETVWAGALKVIRFHCAEGVELTDRSLIRVVALAHHLVLTLLAVE